MWWRVTINSIKIELDTRKIDPVVDDHSSVRRLGRLIVQGDEILLRRVLTSFKTGEICLPRLGGCVFGYRDVYLVRERDKYIFFTFFTYSEKVTTDGQMYKF